MLAFPVKRPWRSGGPPAAQGCPEGALSIYVRPVREQLEHDRVIRFLQTKLKRKFDVAMNVGPDQAAASVKSGTQMLFPDLVLTSTDKSAKLAGVVEVETGESVHHLEAMAQWAPFGRLRVPFHLYVPAASADIAKRLAADLGAHVTELWSYHSIGDQIRLALVEKSAIPGEARRKADRDRAADKRAAASKPAKPKAAAKQAKAAKPSKSKSAKSAKTSKSAKSAKTSAKSKPKAKARATTSARPARKTAKKTARGAARRK